MQISKRPPLNRASAAGFAPKVDGRRLRGARTKQRVIDALLELVREGNRNPRIGEIAERAGCVARSIFDHFVSMNGLRGAATDYAMNQAIALAPLVNADADRQTRISAQVHTRAGTCERTLHLWRLLLAGQSSSPGWRETTTSDVRRGSDFRRPAAWRPLEHNHKGCDPGRNGSNRYQQRDNCGQVEPDGAKSMDAEAAVVHRSPSEQWLRRLAVNESCPRQKRSLFAGIHRHQNWWDRAIIDALQGAHRKNDQAPNSPGLHS